MEQNQELTFYYVENKCPSQNINASWDIWIYLVSRRPQNSNVLHTTPERIIEIIFLNYLLLLKNNTKCLKVY